MGDEVAPTDEFAADGEGLTEDPITGTGGGTSGTYYPNEQKYNSDQAWFNDAKDKLLYDYGLSDVGAVSDALNKYLNNKEVSAEEAKWINFVVNSIGPPPSGTRQVKIGSSSPASTQLAAPTGLAKVGSYPNQVVLKWNAVTGATGYEVRRDGGGTAARKTTSHTSPNLKPSTTYTFRVRAKGSAGQYGPEAIIKAATSAAAKPGSANLRAPQPAATSVKSNAVTIKWAAVPGATGYAISRVGGGQKTQKGRSHTSRGLKSKTEYTFRVRAMRGNTSGPVGTVTVKTK